MKTFVILAALLTTPVVAFAEDANPPATQPAQEARLVPAMRDGKLVGLKIYAIRPGGRCDAAKLQNGDTILAVDDVSVATDTGSVTFHDRVIDGGADATITVLRRGATVKLTSKAK
jgi:type II secretory pathway component PulC